ncbi:alpha-1,4-glucan--maltose-1-phosphate maltosyltransferase [Microbacterium mitrae]|uniref:Alpha-1,4-glucan:maltose-1-phosphate maltosyltransferase n=1 Tax=Microbacterium mitrae TaxID=664640 RepID=A0A5C8HNT0_9MICO|nr:alpha-1,4-glucan--maltose-1-phosphate maltosyltransferase [Microbacterium mitrae]
MSALQSITSVRSTCPIPLRPAPAWQKKRTTLSGRIPLSHVVPAAPGGYRPKGYVGEVIPFEATAFREGHDLIGVQVRLTAPSGEQSLHRLQNTGTGLDRWRVLIAPLEQGVWTYQFESFGDDYATWQHAAHLKLAADVDVDVMREAGALVLERAVATGKHPAADKARLNAAIATLRSADADTTDALAVVDDAELAAVLFARPVMSLITVDTPRKLLVERQRAGVGSWYEFFPRSEGAKRLADGTIASGTFATAQRRLAEVAAMGFDVVYLPPIHPIGTINRKGPNNTLVAAEGDPGSPWAIGSAAGGHDAIHPDLGTLKDFRAFVSAARKEGIEIAIDLALQAAPDHPWVTEHPEWFTTLPDGTIAYAENPPKKYQDIYPINFDNDPEGIRAEVLRVVRHWIAQGVTIFRVDNPHTKPLQFWEWLIAEVLREDPDIVFLAEAFTRPAPLQALAAAGFQQSYTYFTWRNTKTELAEFLTGLATETADFLRPNLFVNTPDILTEYLQYGGRAAFAIRAIVAATAAPTWGVYAGYELFESVARPGAEENIDSEKYEYKLRDFAAAEAAGDSLAPLLRTLNAIRDVHPALEQLRSFTVHDSEDDAILVYSKHIDAALSPQGKADTIIVVVNVDPHSVRETMVHLDTSVFGIQPGEQFAVVDLLTGAEWTWGDHNYVRLDAFTQPAHILWVKR